MTPDPCEQCDFVGPLWPVTQQSTDLHRAWHDLQRTWHRAIGPIVAAFRSVASAAQQTTQADYTLIPPTPNLLGAPVSTTLTMTHDPKPEWKPGTSGTATVRTVPNIRVMRLDGITQPWASATFFAPAGDVKGDGQNRHDDWQVTDFVPDVPLLIDGALPPYDPRAVKPGDTVKVSVLEPATRRRRFTVEGVVMHRIGGNLTVGLSTIMRNGTWDQHTILLDHKPAMPELIEGELYDVDTTNQEGLRAYWKPIDGIRANHPWLDAADQDIRYRTDFVVRAHHVDAADPPEPEPTYRVSGGQGRRDIARGVTYDEAVKIRDRFDRECDAAGLNNPRTLINPEAAQ